MKKLLSLFLATLLCFSCCLCVSAQGVQPRWKELASLGLDLKNYNGIYNNAEVITSAQCFDSSIRMDFCVTITRWNGSAYVDTDLSWTDSGYLTVGVSKKFRLGEGNYIARVDVSLYDKNGAFIETVTSYSNQIVI